MLAPMRKYWARHLYHQVCRYSLLDILHSMQLTAGLNVAKPTRGQRPDGETRKSRHRSRKDAQSA